VEKPKMILSVDCLSLMNLCRVDEFVGSNPDPFITMYGFSGCEFVFNLS
jgi:hypothetical protein